MKYLQRRRERLLTGEEFARLGQAFDEAETQGGASAVNLLAALPRDPDTPWVVPGAKPGRHVADIDGARESIRAKVGLHDVRIHDIRHSFASRALALGEGLPIIGRLLGHRRVETTARYAHLARDSVRESVERIAVGIAAEVL